MKNNLKVLLGLLAEVTFASKAFRFIQRKKLIVIYYHRVLKSEEFSDVKVKNIVVNIKSFEEQIKFISERYNAVSEKDIISAVERRGKMPEFPIWITFDDGYKDNYTNAFPILKKYSIPATFFVTTGYVNKTATPEVHFDNDIFMNWQEIKEVAEEGISIGAHTVSHRILSTLSDREVEKEIIESKNEIEQRLGKSVISFAYPVGKKPHYYLEKCVPVLKKNNFMLGVTTIGGFNAIQFKKDSFNLRRIGLSYEDTLNFFKFKISLGGFWQT